jgi:two-component system LytT family sensor kinase
MRAKNSKAHLVRPEWQSSQVDTLQRMLDIARLFQDGLTPATALNFARTIYSNLRVLAVGVYDRQTCLAFIGSEPQSCAGNCPALQQTFETGTPQTCKQVTACWQEGKVPADSLLTIALQDGEQAVGVLVLYNSADVPLKPADLELARLVAGEVTLNLQLARLKGSAGQLAEAELRALRAQISPHFLFNTLNSIAAMVRIDAEGARELIVEFANFFRRTLKHPHGEFVTLAEELDYVNHYLNFEKVRFGNNLKVKIDIAPGVENVVIPVLTVQPLVENAVQHGINPKIGGGTVKIKASYLSFGEVLIEVSDDGMGMDLATKGRIPRQSRQNDGLGMALGNIEQRLQRLFGSEYTLGVESAPGVGTKVSFRVPRSRRTV